MIKNKDETKPNVNFLPRLDVDNDEIITDKIANNTANNNEEQSEMELSESDLQLQVRKIDVIIFLLLDISELISILKAVLVLSRKVLIVNIRILNNYNSYKR